MSSYGVHPSDIDYSICRTCKTETSAWIAEAFSCSKCGNTKSISPPFSKCKNESDRMEEKSGNKSSEGDKRQLDEQEDLNARKRSWWSGNEEES